MASAAEEEASRLGYGLVIYNTRNQLDRELDFLDKLHARFVDGLLLVTSHVDLGGSLRQRLEKCGHVVLLDEDIEGAMAPRIMADNFSGAEMATHELIQAGHERDRACNQQTGSWMRLKNDYLDFCQLLKLLV